MRKVNLYNKTKESTILSEVYVAEQFFHRLKGLLGTKNLDKETGLLIRPCNSVHTFFMKFPIDVAFVDKNGQVCYIIHSMKKNRASPIVKNALYVVEASSGVFINCGLEVGDIIDII